MAASLSGVFSLQEFTDLGAPLVGGRVYTYAQGTTTHKTAYTDKAGTVPHTYTSDGIGGQYIGLNARGELPASLYLAAGSYDITLKDSTGATIWTRRADPVDDSAAALDAALRADLASTSGASKGTGMQGHNATLDYAEGTVGSAINDLFITPRMFPFLAVADGIADDKVALQAAMTHAASVGVTLRASPGNVFLIGSGLAIPPGLVADFGGATIKRKTGSVYNMLSNNGGTKIKIQRLTVDGNRQADGRVATNVNDRFGGIVLTSVTDSELRDVTVNNTVNAEDGRAGVYLNACTGVDLYNVGGSGNDRSCVYIENSTKVRLFGSTTANNLGSGVTSQLADDCEYYDVTAVNSGYSGISINGKRSKGRNLRATGTAVGYAGVNIGHDDNNNRADDSIIENIHSYDNAGWGVVVAGSARVQLRGVYTKGNTNHNLQVGYNSSACTLSGLTSTGSALSGAIFTSGKGHKITSGEIFGNAYYGVDVETGCSATISSDVRIYNNCTADNTLAGVLLNGAVDCTVDAECFDDQGVKTQGYGVWLVGGSGNMLGGYLHDLKTAPIQESSAPVYTARNVRAGNNSMLGSFQPGAGVTSVTINNNNARSGMTVVFQPANAAGRTLGLPILSTITAGTSFVANLGGAAAGTESYTYTIL